MQGGAGFGSGAGSRFGMRMAGWRLASSAGCRLRGFYDLSAQPGMGGIVLEALVPDHGR